MSLISLTTSPIRCAAVASPWTDWSLDRAFAHVDAHDGLGPDLDDDAVARDRRGRYDRCERARHRGLLAGLALVCELLAIRFEHDEPGGSTEDAQRLRHRREIGADDREARHDAPP